jgi:hypothetical protein
VTRIHLSAGLLAIPRATSLLALACTTHLPVDPGDAGADSGGIDGGFDASFDAAPGDAGYLEAPPWEACPPRSEQWSDPAAEEATQRFFERARTGDPCTFGFLSLCGGYHGSDRLPIPGLPGGIDYATVGCVNGYLVLSTAIIDCADEIGDAPWSGGSAWTEAECTAFPRPTCAETGAFRCVRRLNDCCVDVEACSAKAGSTVPVRQRICDPTCAGFPGGRRWDECPRLGDAVVGERCSIDALCPATDMPALNLIAWCDGEHYRVVFDAATEAILSNCVEES